jgi:hypothetical protein
MQRVVRPLEADAVLVRGIGERADREHERAIV